MVRLAQLPEQQIIDSLAGVVDFYYYKCVPCARRWPRRDTAPQQPAEAEMNDLFKDATAALSLLTEEDKQALEALAEGTPLTWKDWWYRLQLSTNYFNLI